MQELIHINNTDVVFALDEGKVFTDSLSISETFGKLHKDVMRIIRRMPRDDFWERNFTPSDYIDTRGKKQSLYQITRDGFSMLVMGFTGQNAYKWKVQFIEAFNLMEQKLRGTHTQPMLAQSIHQELHELKEGFAELRAEREEVQYQLRKSTSAMKRLDFALENMPMDTYQLAHIRKVVGMRGKELAEANGVALTTATPTIYRALNQKFNVYTYTEIKREHYEACLEFIQYVTL